MRIWHENTAGFRLLLGLALLLASWLALTPNPIEMPQGMQLDKLAHLATYLLLAFLVDASWPDRGFGLPKWAFLLGYGIAIELIQSQIPNRVFSLADVAANATGIVLYALLIRRALRAAGLRYSA